MAIDDATSSFLAALPAGRPLREMTVDEVRAMHTAMTELYGPGPEMAAVEDHMVPSFDGVPVCCRLLVPEGSVDGLVIFLHGGGWVMGGLDDVDTLARELASRSRSAVLLVDYRLAPEHPYPTPVEDCWAALVWADRQVEELLGRRVPIVVGGDSAGGNLAAVLAQRARANQIDLALQVLIYPVLDSDFDTPTYLDDDNQLIVDREGMEWFWDHYAPEASRTEPSASPARASDLSGLAPAVIVLAEHDVLRDEGERYADALRAAGGDVDLRVFEGQMHLFFTLVNVLPASGEAIDHVAQRISRVVSPPGS